jgi:hypothetical protein
MEVYKTSIENTSTVLTANMVDMNNFIVKCVELRDDMKAVETLALQV